MISTSCRPTSTSTTRSRGVRTRCCNRQSREAYQRLLAQGWTDSLRALHPDEPIYTFWDYFRNHWQRNAGLRIDHLLLNPTLAPRLVEAGVDTWVRGQPHASDHAPAWMVIDQDKLGKKPGARRSVGRKTSPKRRDPET